MKKQQTAAIMEDNLCSFPTIVHSQPHSRQQIIESLELRRLISHLLYSIKDIASAQTEPLRVLSAIASGDEISPVLSGELRAEVRACAHARIRELGDRAKAHLDFLERSSDW